MKAQLAIAFLITVLISGMAHAAPSKAVRIDLAKGNVTGYLMDSQVGQEIDFILINNLQKATYDYKYAISSESTTLPSDVFTRKPDTTIKNEMAAVYEQKNSGKCTEFNAAIQSLFDEKSEKKVPQHIHNISSAYGQISDENTKNSCLSKYGYSTLDQLIERLTTETIASVTVRQGETITLTIMRKSPTEAWTHVYNTKPRGAWRASWGFAAIQNKNESYYSASDGATGYVVTKGDSGADVELDPIVMFHWANNENDGSDSLDHGLTAGLGLDLTNPTLLAGYSATLNQNLTFTAGAAARQFNVLKGRYSDGPTLTDAVDSTDLVEKAYKWAWFVSVAFRFGTNPF